jgi:hypothetical protein
VILIFVFRRFLVLARLCGTWLLRLNDFGILGGLILRFLWSSWASVGNWFCLFLRGALSFSFLLLFFQESTDSSFFV